MSAPDPGQPQEHDNAKPKSRLEALASDAWRGTAGWIQAGFTDWYSFLSGPTDPPFNEGQTFHGELHRLFRLLAIVGILSGFIVVTKDILSGNAALGVIVLESPAAIQLLLIGAILALIYYFVLAKVFGVPVTLPQSLFTIMLLGLPWLPLTALIYSFSKGNIAWGTFAWVFWFYFSPFVLVGNFSRGISSICPGCSKWRIRGSFVVPILILILGFLLVGTGRRDTNSAVQGDTASQANKNERPSR